MPKTGVGDFEAIFVPGSGRRNTAGRSRPGFEPMRGANTPALFGLDLEQLAWRRIKIAD
jgi:hypothetical protein